MRLWFKAALLVFSFGMGTQAGPREVPPQATAPGVTRIGELGGKLPDQEIAELAKQLPGFPWLISGDGPGPFDSPERTIQHIRAYLLPTITTPGLRRGPMVHATRQSSPTLTGWTMDQPVMEYAQVAIDGRNFDQIQSEHDINLPFVISGINSEAELISAVRFVRAKYSLPISSVMMSTDESVPSFLKLQPGDIRVGLRKTSTSGLSVILRRQGQAWTVISELVRNV